MRPKLHQNLLNGRVRAWSGGHAFGAHRLTGRVTAWLIVLILCMGALPAKAAGEYEIKAAFLFNFAKFIEWPALTMSDTNTPLIIGIVGADPFGEILRSTIVDETVKGRRLELRHYQTTNDFTGCHVLFIGRSETGGLKQLLERASACHILTVGEADDFLEQGGMINFLLVGKNVRFDINRAAVERAGLKISSKLMAVAHAEKEHP